MNAPDEATYFISPSEPPLLKALGVTSPIVEKKGCDVLIVLPSIRAGIQRKTWIDLIISLDDGRLAGSIVKMDMPARIIVIEGKTPFFDRSGHMVVRSNSRRSKGGYMTLRHTKESLFGVMLSMIFRHNLNVLRTDSLSDTALLITRIGKYLGKKKHRGIVGDRTQAARSSPWGVVDAEERKRAGKINFLMAMGMGHQTAMNLLDACGGKIPLQWTVDKYELTRVPLIGESTADRLLGFLE